MILLLSFLFLIFLHDPTGHAFLLPNPSPSLRRNTFFRRAAASPSAASSPEEDLKLTRQIIKSYAQIREVAASSPEEDLTLTREIIMKHIQKYDDALLNDDDDDDEIEQQPLMIRAALGNDVSKTPVWLFRQAGRHLPEYREYKERVGRNFLELLQHPEDVAECTLQPLRRYDVDAAILFSDILVIPQAIGMEVTMPGGVGIQVPNPISSPQTYFDNYNVHDDDVPNVVDTKLRHVLEGVKLIKRQMQDEGYPHKPLIGFSAAPFTLLFYMVGGSSKRNPEAGIDFLRRYPDQSKLILNQLTNVVVEYLVKQVEMGCDLLQLFEAMGMMIPEQEFLEFELTCLERIGNEVKERVGEGVPLMVFARGASYANTHLAKLSTYDVITIDGSVNRSTARETLPNKTLQGNYDPKELIAEEGKTKDTVQTSVKEMLEELGPRRLIANLGEGLGGKEDPELVKEFVDSIHGVSQTMMK